MIFVSKMNNEMKDENLIIKKRYLRIINNGGTIIGGFLGMGIHQIYFGATFKFMEPIGFKNDKYNITTIDERRFN